MTIFLCAVQYILIAYLLGVIVLIPKLPLNYNSVCKLYNLSAIFL